MGDPALCRNALAVYHPRRPTDPSLYRLLREHFDHFEQIYDEQFSCDYGFYRLVISEVSRTAIASMEEPPTSR